MQKRLLQTLTTAFLIVGLVSACGGGDSANPDTAVKSGNQEETGTPDTTESGEDASTGGGEDAKENGKAGTDPEKAKFIKEADAICRKADEAQSNVLKEISEMGGFEKLSEAEQQELVAAKGLQPVQRQAEELAELEPPSGDEAEVEAIVTGIEAAITQAKKESETKNGVVGEPFKSVQAQTKSYGFEDCADPL